MITPSFDNPHEIIYIVDDNDAVRDSLRILLEANHYQTLCFSSAEDFLQHYRQKTHLDKVSCLILDIRLSGMSGVALQDQLIAEHFSIPTLFITGHADVQLAVSTMKKGAVDFIEKPFDEADLRQRIQHMLEQAHLHHATKVNQRLSEEKLAKLTTREHQVLERIIAGRLNKQIADDLNISIKTVEAHRANIMEKLNVNTVASLLKLALTKQSVVTK